jgi:hypothetical protein
MTAIQVCHVRCHGMVDSPHDVACLTWRGVAIWTHGARAPPLVYVHVCVCYLAFMNG